jgi:hypothetical protein
VLGGAVSRVARFIFYFALGGTLVGCASYIIEPGRLLLADVQDVSISQVRSVVGPLLGVEGFEDLGLDEEMMRLLGLSAESQGGSYRLHRSPA